MAYIGAKVGTLVTAGSSGDVTVEDATPEVTLKNTTETDADGSRGGKITFKGEQSGGEESTLAQIVGSHDTALDNEAGDLIFKTNDGSDGTSPTERLRIDSDGNIGVNINAPSSMLHLFDGGTDTGITLQSKVQANATASITLMSRKADNSNVNAVLKNVDGKIQSSVGIMFGSDTADANALDDYEEGTFNFTLSGYWGSPSPKLTIPAHYTKIGNVVHFWAHRTSMNTTGYSGNMTFQGLPFTSPSPYSIGTLSLDHIGTYSGYGPHLLISGNDTYGVLHQSNASSWSAIMHNVHTSAGAVYLTGHYKV